MATADGSEAGFDVERYRREKLARLDRDNVYLAAELRRAYLLLGLALEVATADRTCRAADLLEVLCSLIGTNPARGAAVQQEETRARLAAEISLLEADVDREAQRRRVETRAA